MKKQSRELLLINKEKKLLIAGAVLGMLLFAAYCIFLYIPLYQTKTKILVRNIPKQNIMDAQRENPLMRSESGFSNPLFNILQIFGSDRLAFRVYDKLSENYPTDMNKFKLKSNEKWPKILNKKLLKAKIEPSTDIIKISFSWVNKKNTHKALNIIIDEFKSMNLEIRKEVEKRQRKYINKQLADIEIKLNDVRNKIKNYKLKNYAFNIENELSELTKARIDLEKQAEVLRSTIAFENSKLADLSRQLGFKDAQSALKATAIGEDQYLKNLNNDLTKAEQEYASLRAKFSVNYPEVKSVKNQIEVIKENIEKRQKETLQNVIVKRGIYDKPSQDLVTDMARVQSDRFAHIAELKILEKGIDNLLSKEAELPTKQVGLENLRKKESVLADAYNRVKQRQLNAIMNENEIVDNIVMLSEGSAPRFAFKALLLKAFIFLFFGIILGASIAYIKQELQNKWMNSQEIEDSTGKKVIGIIPWVKGDYANQEIALDNDSLLGLSYTNITRKLISLSYKDQIQSVSFVSTVDRRNNSTIIPNIAANMAKLNRSVVLVDTDLSLANKMPEILDASEKSNFDLIDIIDEINKATRFSKSIDLKLLSDIIKKAIVPIALKLESADVIKFDYLYSKKDITNLYDYLATKGFDEVINYLKRTYEFVLIDSPTRPAFYPEVQALSSMSDGVVIISAMETNRNELIQVINNIEESSAKIMGILPRENNSELQKYFEQKGLKTEVTTS